MSAWFEITNEHKFLTPLLLFYPDPIDRNIDKMIGIAGHAGRIRSHVKTYKCGEIVNMQLTKGIGKFKCATLSEAMMVATSGAKDILVAYPLIGPWQEHFHKLAKSFPDCRFSVLVDHQDQLHQWNQQGIKANLFIDLDLGMHRTGIKVSIASGLYHEVASSIHQFAGWHIYDGHIHQTNPNERQHAVEADYAELDSLISETNTSSAELVCGSSITFTIHAKYADRTLAPGTTLLWDHGYSSLFPDLPFELAATILTRVISKPGTDLLCLDLGYKAIAAEMKVAPAFFPQITDAIIVTHSEEHMVIQTKEAGNLEIGDCLYAFPWHICPSVALHDQAGVVNDGLVNEFWEIKGRKRIYQ